MDGQNEGIENRFNDIYANLYNSSDDKQNIVDLLSTVNDEIIYTIGPEAKKFMADHVNLTYYEVSRLTFCAI